MKTVRKNALILLTAAALLAALIPAGAFAVDGCDLWICGAEVTPDRLSGPGWSYDQEGNRLNLEGFVYKGSDVMYQKETSTIFGVINYYGDRKLTITLTGENSISVEGMAEKDTLGHAVYVLSSSTPITFSGDGSLDITTEDVDGVNIGIWARDYLVGQRGTVRVATGGGSCSYPLKCDGNLQVGYGSLEFIAGASDRPCGIMCGGEMIVHGGSVSAVCGQITEADRTSDSERYSYGISVKGWLHMDGGQVFAKGGDTGTLGSQMSVGLLVSGIELSGGTVTAQGGEANYQSLGCGCLGPVYMEGGELTAAGGSATGIFQAVSGSLKIPMGVGSFGLLANSRQMPVEVKSGTVTLKAGKSLTGMSIALRANGTVTVSGGSLTADADEGGIQSTGVDNQGTLTVVKGVKKFTASGLSEAVLGDVVTQIKGVGYSDAAGTKDKKDIKPGEEAQKLKFRKVKLPAITFN